MASRVDQIESEDEIKWYQWLLVIAVALCIVVGFLRITGVLLNALDSAVISEDEYLMVEGYLNNQPAVWLTY